MTESQFLEQSSKDFDTLTSEIDAELAKATDETWHATRPDNGWTTAQIVEHLWRTAEHYQDRVGNALASAPVSDGTAEARLGLFTRLIMKGLASRKTPAPKKLVVRETIPPETAQEHWDRFKALIRAEIDSAKGKSLSQPRFGNPFASLFKMSFIDHLTLQIEHLHYHGPQLRARLLEP